METVLKDWLDEVLSDAENAYKYLVPQNVAVNMDGLKSIHKKHFAETIDDYYAGNIEGIKQRHEFLGKEHYKIVHIVYCKKFIREVEFSFNKKLFSVLRSSCGSSGGPVSENIISDIRNIFNLITDYMSLGYLRAAIEEENKLIEEPMEKNAPDEGLPTFFIPFIHWTKNIMEDVYNTSRKPSVELNQDKCALNRIISSEELSRKLPERTIRALDILHRRVHKEAYVLYDLLQKDFYGDIDLVYHSFMKLNLLLFSMIAGESAKVQLAEIKQADEAVKESEELLKTLTDNLPIGIGMHKEKYIYTNPEFKNMFGYAEKELENIYAWEVDAEEYRDAAKIRIKRGLLDINDKYDIIVQGIKKSGERLWMHIYTNSVKYKGKIVRVASFIDITEMVVLRNALEQERDLFRVLIENIHSGIALFNKDKFLYINAALLDLFNCTKEEFLNLSPNSFFSIGEEQIYDIDSAVFDIHHNKEISSNIIYKYTKSGSNILYIDLFRTAVTYNNEQTGLAIFLDVTDRMLKEQNILSEKETFKELSEHDALTGIGNRRSFDDKLVGFLNIALRYNRPLSLIMFDIDRFKDINDKYGHETGDFILKELCSAVKEDLRTTDFFARYGGEEFMVISPETSLKTAAELAERLRLKTEKHNFNIGQAVTCSFGVTEVKSGDTLKSIVYRTDTALYEAKEEGRNQVKTG